MNVHVGGHKLRAGLALVVALAAGPLPAALAAPAVAPGTGSAYVRVNQVGDMSGSAMRAYLLAAGSEAGATFAVKNAAGATVYSAPVGANLGSWSAAYPDVY